MKETYRNIFKYPTLNLQTAKLTEKMKAVPIDLTFPILDKSSLFGIEVEVEGLEDYPSVPPFWTVTEDNSLRNWGREYISRPIKGKQVEYAIRLLFSKLADYPYEFSPRCSIHVHCNARTMTPEQLHNMLLLYLVFEKILFRFVGQDRDKNIHCVPLSESILTQNLYGILSKRFYPQDWMKYTAVNLVPLNQKGTIEFRQMHGTDDIQKILTWINLILKLKLYAYKNKAESVEAEVFELNSNSQYQQFLLKVFGNYSSVLLEGLNYSDSAKLMEDNITLAKLIYLQKNTISFSDIKNEKLNTLFFKSSSKKKTTNMSSFNGLLNGTTPSNMLVDEIVDSTIEIANYSF